MGEIILPEKKKVISGFIFSDDNIYLSAKKDFEVLYGKTDYESSEMPFSHTKYYGDELQGSLKRRFISFEKLVDPGELADIKICSNEIEERYKDDKGSRRINIDPGMLSMAKLILATTKNYQHRIYMGKGIFAEVTLRYSSKEKRFTTWEWTYPDYATADYIKVFGEIRSIYSSQIS